MTPPTGGYNLDLNALKTVETVVDFRKHVDTHSPAPITLCGSLVHTVDSFSLLETLIPLDLMSELNLGSLIKRAQQRMHFLWQPKEVCQR